MSAAVRSRPLMTADDWQDEFDQVDWLIARHLTATVVHAGNWALRLDELGQWRAECMEVLVALRAETP